MAIKHLFTEENIGIVANFRPIGLHETKKLLPYMQEVESEWAIPYLTASFFATLTDDPQAYADVLEETYYNNNNAFSEGLNRACAYLCYSRFLRNRDITVTASGMRLKEQELSQTAPNEEITRLANESEEIGKKYLMHVKNYCIYKGYITAPSCVCSAKEKATLTKKKIIIIGK